MILGIMIRTALAAVGLAALSHVVHADEPRPQLNELVTLSGDLVRIGDLVDNPGPAANIAVFRAPDLGHTGTVAVQTVLDTLNRHGVTQVETNGLSEVIVTRPSRSIGIADIEARIASVLAGQRGLGAADSLKVTLDREMRTLHVEPDATAELAVTRLRVDPRSGRFSVAFELPGSAIARRLPLRFTGSVTETMETAVLLRRMDRGDVVRAGDVSLERRPRSELSAGSLQLDQVVGMAVRRPLRAGEVVRATDLVHPEIVRRNETVTIHYEVPGITLTVRGRANEGGGAGDTISVLNVQSNRTVQARIIGPGRVAVTPNRPRTLAAAMPHPAMPHPSHPVSQ